jgi:ATP-dependent Clp protease ATP-binding subunit ClpA
VIHHVVDKFIFDLEGKMAQKKVTLTVEPEAKEWLAEHGYKEKMGARPMERLIKEKISKPLAEELLFGALSEGGLVRVYVDDKELKFELKDHIVH